MKRIAESYDGWCEIDGEKENIFMVNILLRLKDKSDIS